MSENKTSEIFDTGLSKIRHEIKSQLVLHGLYGIVTTRTANNQSGQDAGLTIEIASKGRVATRSFEPQQIEACHLRVGGAVLAGIISMAEELAA
jgi:uncharacterized protein with GYD domain